MSKDNTIKFYGQYRLYIFPAVVAISCLILIIFIIFPQVIKLIANSKVESEFKTRSKFLEAKAEALQNYDEADLSRKVGNIFSSIPAEKDFANVLGLLQGLTTQSGFNIISLSFGQIGGSSVKQSYGVKVELLGPKTSLGAFIDNIESSTRLMRISSMDITSGKADFVNVALGIEALFSTVPAKLGTVDSPLPEISDKDEQLLTKLARTTTRVAPTPYQLSPKGKVDPFE